MQIMNTFVAKIGPAGKRNRAARRRLARRNMFNRVPTCAIVPAKLDLSVVWDRELACKAMELFNNSGMSQRSFAAEHNFPESRLRSWKKKLAN